MIGITLLGSTGSIGNSSLDVISRHPQRYQVIALTANRNVTVMLAQCERWRPEFAVMLDDDSAQQLHDKLNSSDTQVLSGVEGLIRVAQLPQTDVVIAGIVGAAGLLPTLAATEAGKRILLANTERLRYAHCLPVKFLRHWQTRIP